MISIRRYLQDDGNTTERDAVPAHSDVLSKLCTDVLHYIGAYVLTGEFSQFRPRLEQAVAAMSADLSGAEAAEVEESIREVLSGYNRIAQEAQQNNAIEMQQMVGVLSHALSVLAGGSERAVSRLQRIQSTVQHTSRIQDTSALRASLRDIVQLIDEESSKEQQNGVRERAGLETQVVRFRQRLAENPNRRLLGREEAIRTVSDSLAVVPPGKTVWVIVFVLEQLTAIAQRYGPEAMEDLFLQVIRERLHPVSPTGNAFRWTPSSIVGVTQMDRDIAGLQSEMARINHAPLVCRVALGNRTAVLKVGLSHLAMEVTGSSKDQVLSEIDRFTGFGTEGSE